jgi:hypothetical protein
MEFVHLEICGILFVCVCVCVCVCEILRLAFGACIWCLALAFGAQYLAKNFEILKFKIILKLFFYYNYKLLLNLNKRLFFLI